MRIVTYNYITKSIILNHISTQSFIHMLYVPNIFDSYDKSLQQLRSIKIGYRNKRLYVKHN